LTPPSRGARAPGGDQSARAQFLFGLQDSELRPGGNITPAGVQLQSLEVRVPSDLDRTLRAASREHANGLTVLTDHVTLYHRAQLAELAAKYRLPAIYNERLFAEAGGLVSYGASDREMHRRAAIFVAKILNGAKPSELPVEQPATYELVINLKTAKA